MQQENDDMDELFRKAAENYPLKTDNADWEKVRSILAVESLDNFPAKNKNRRGLWLLLFLLPLGWAGYNYILFPGTSNKNVAIKHNTSLSNKNSQTTINQNNGNDGIEKADQSNPDQSALSNSGTILYAQKNSANKNVIVPSKTLLPANYQSSDDKKTGKEDVRLSGNANVDLTKNTTENKTQDIAENKNDKLINEVSNNTLKEDKNIITTDTTKNSDQILKKENKNKKQKNKFLYAGIIGGPDISTVKSHSVKNTGFNMGIILGYQLNKKLSIETGLMWDKKFYYSEGKYFSTRKIYLPPNAKITNVNGNCSMIEIPLNVKYNFKSSGKTNWFTAAGLSSYFMKKENYKYTIVSTGAPYPYSKTYNQSSTFLLSALNVSAGYSHSLGKNTSLRVEPYAKIPLKGVGIGSLPITSVGVNMGVTKKLF